MEISERNKKVAVARWKKIHDIEKDKIKVTNKNFNIKAAICGFLAGDGSVQIRKEKKFTHYQIDFFPDDKIMLDTYLSFIREIYNKKPSVKNKAKFYSVRLTSRTMVEDLSVYAKFGIYRWNVPWSLLKTNTAKAYWLKAFFSAEAYVGNNVIKIQTVNKDGMLDVSKLLNELDINHSFYEYTPKRSNLSKVAMIFIIKKQARKLFHEKIGFWHDKKESAIKKSLNL